MIQQPLHASVGDLFEGFVVFARLSGNEIMYQRRKVFFALPQGWYCNGEDIQSVEEITPEIVVQYFGGKGTICGR